MFRDPSIVYFGGYFHLAYTTELCVGLERPGFDCHWEQRSAHAPPARFGYARSVDLTACPRLAWSRSHYSARIAR